MDYSETLRNAEKMLLDGYTGQAVIAAGQVLEALLQSLVQSTLLKLKSKDQQVVSEKLEKIGKGKAVTELTLGQLVGLFRETDLFEKCEAALGRKLPRLRAGDYNGLTDLRNRAAHAAGGEIEEDEARLMVSQVRVFAREAGLLEQPKVEQRRDVPAGRLLSPWSQTVKLHPDVASGQTATAIYAIDLGALVAGDKSVPTVYLDPEAFFRATHPTRNMVALIAEVLGRLVGGQGDRVLQLRSPFGGGKSHILAALYHATKSRQALDAIWPEARQWPKAETVRVAVFDGEKFDVQGREVAPGIRVQTLWGWIAWRLGGAPLYEVVRHHDERRVAPSGDVIAKLLGRGETEEPPTLIMLDEVLKYFERAQAETTIVGESTLGRQTLEFIQTLSTEVAHAHRAVMIYSLQASAGEAFGNIALLSMLDHLTARVDSKREPVVGDEILPVLQRRLLAATPASAVADQIAEAFSTVVINMRSAQARTASEKRTVQDEALALRRRFQAAYPFHPALIDVMKERWASIPDFQRTRGALRFLSACLHALKDGSGVLLGPGDIPLANGAAQYAFFAEVGRREAFQAVLEADFTGPNARARRIDERLAAEFPHLSGVRPAMRLATAILMYSFGGLQRPGEEAGQVMATGVTEPELLAAVVGPDLDNLTAQTALKALREECLFLHYDGAHYVFKTTPNVTQLLEDEFNNNVQPPEADAKIKEELEKRLASRAALIWPASSMNVDDREPRFTLVYLALDYASWGEARQKEYALNLLLNRGDALRHYRNGLGLALPNWHQIETVRRAMRYVLAIGRLRTKRNQLNLTPEQVAQLKEREGTENDKVESAFRELYNSVCLPAIDSQQPGGIGLDKIEAGARPLAATGIHERLMELLTTVYHKVHGTLKPQKILEHMRMGEYAPEVEGCPLGLRTGQIVDAFFETLGFPRLLDDGVVRRAIADGIKDGYFGYAGRTDRIQTDRVRDGSGYQIPRVQVIFGDEVPVDEIDLESGFIVLPAGIEPAAPPAEPGEGGPAVPPTPGEPGTPSPVPPAPPADKSAPSQTHVQLRLRVTRAQLYITFNALANLADKAGSIGLDVTAEVLEGIDPVWLRNAVTEPLDEVGVEVKGE